MPRVKCTKCLRPIRGHSGPTDDECTLDQVGDNYGHGSYEDVSFDSETSEREKSPEATGGIDPGNPSKPGLKKTTPRGKSDAAFAMKEILLQLGHLTCSVQKMADENKTLTANQMQQHADLIQLKGHLATPGPIPAVTPALRAPPAYIPPAVNYNVPPAVNYNVPPVDAAAGVIQQGTNSSLELPIPLPNGARVSKKTYLSARAGEYINLPEFAPNSEPS